MDVGVWLGNLGLGQYEAAFRDNEIDGAVLPKLTLDDLKDLGVTVVGHRRKIMSAIEELGAEFVARTDPRETIPTQAASPISASPDGAERRPITVMFCDLVGSTSLAAKLDAVVRGETRPKAFVGGQRHRHRGFVGSSSSPV